ncbi:excalibur calcium-binding domain-containing protein [Sphingomonas sp. KR3-1]|uniref:excalibur calcium-binding domain-containing protein n=1 Tax=Sphingomonas sp. KR3-1 TaxID=3156611 RepID=UPI0032B4D7D9
MRTLLLVWGAVAIGTWAAMPQLLAVSSAVTTTPEQRAAIERSAYYRNCNDARAAGAAPMYRGQAGYREGLDGDSDGIACEPYRQ